ncbi:helicase associated domain-containing protein [Streptomyces griseosporeus]|uniref:helicase associated domain-containing protein n=1 Tax=Streptomyces griseosporeus TaxID=1910 RepID=UPI0037B78012
MVGARSWLHRQLTTWPALSPGQQQLMTALGLTPETNPLSPARRTRRTFEETVQLLELFLHREGRTPAARETIRVDGDTVKLGAWLAKTRHRRRSGQLPDHHVRLVAALFDGDWAAEDAVPAVLA